MTPHEKELLTRFLQLLAGAQAGHKDAEAEALIKDVCARQPDAAYLLVQRTMQLEQLLQASQEEVQRLKAEASQPRAGSSGGFLGDPNAWGRHAVTPAAQAPAGSARAAAPVGAPPASAAGAAPGRSWNSGLFGNIATTAAGVVAGSFLYQGIQGLMKRDEPQTTAQNTHATPSHETEPELLSSYESESGDGGDTLASDDFGGGDLA